MKKSCCEARYKLIVMDINMPVMDGITAAKRIFQLGERLRAEDPSLPAVTITAVHAFDDERLRSTCKEVGMQHYIFKPVSQDQIEAILR